MEFVPNPEPSPFDPAGEPVLDSVSPVDSPDRQRVATEPRSRPGAVRRTVATLILAAGLLAVGGVSAVWAASPDPSAATTPSTTTPSTTPSDGTTHPKGDCPKGSGTPSGTNGSTSSPSTSG